MRPASKGFEHSLQVGYGLARDGQTNSKGFPKDRLALAWLFEISESNLPGWMSIFEFILRRQAKKAREHVERNRARVLRRIEAMVRWAIDRSALPADLDVELFARAIRSLSEEAGRMLLIDSERYSPRRYRRFVRTVSQLIWSN